jgi:histone-lysine N-methyltransferase SETD1
MPVHDVNSLPGADSVHVVVYGYDPLLVNAQKIRGFLSQYGDIKDAVDVIEKGVGTPLGICRITFKDRNSRAGPMIRAAEAARRAVKEANNSRIDSFSVRVERDPDHLRSKRIMAIKVAAKKKKTVMQDKRLPASTKKIVVTSQKHSVSSPIASTPPPNAPKGPSHRPAAQQPIQRLSQPAQRAPLQPVQRTVPQPVVQPAAKPAPAAAPPEIPGGNSVIEKDSVLNTIRREPYIFIAHCYVPVLPTTLPHLEKRMKSYDWNAIRVDATGYYIVFRDTKGGEEEAKKCYKTCHLHLLFTYTMNMELNLYGNPDRPRSPTPERVLAEKEDEEDFEIEKRERAAKADPSKIARALFEEELLKSLLDSIRDKIASPILDEFLTPDNQKERREKHGIAEPKTASTAATFMFPSNSFPANDLRRKAMRPKVDEEEARFTVKRQQKKRNVIQQKQPQLVSLLDQIDQPWDDESDDESRSRITRDSSRGVSEALRSPRHEVDEDGLLTPASKRLRLTYATNSVDSEDEKDFSKMSNKELQVLLSTLSKKDPLHKSLKQEISYRKEIRSIDEIFEDGTGAMDPLADDISIDTPLVSTRQTKTKKKPPPKPKAKSKKLIKQREDDTDTVMTDDISTPTIVAEEDATPAAEEDLMPEYRPEVEWSVSTEEPRKTVDDDKENALDFSGWKFLVKGEENDVESEDIRFLKIALAKYNLQTPEIDVNYWAWKEKEFSGLHSQSKAADPEKPIHITGYYVPSASGCARTEVIEKIKQDEKSKYLPHRRRAKERREKNQQELKKGGKGKATSDIPETNKGSGVKPSTISSRSNRAEIRRQEKAAHTNKNTLETDDSSYRINALSKRKKNVRFARSSIHGWGLYAQEPIPLGDMIIEYVGEKVRQKVADCREVAYTRQGIGSSYLFRIDEDTVIDATKKGGIARFINHSCAPNCTAKIIKVGNSRRIVIYALNHILAGSYQFFHFFLPCTNSK